MEPSAAVGENVALVETLTVCRPVATLRDAETNSPPSAMSRFDRSCPVNREPAARPAIWPWTMIFDLR